MRKEFIILLRCRLQAYGTIYPIIRAERHYLVAAIDDVIAGVDQVLDRIMLAGFKDFEKPIMLDWKYASGFSIL